MKNDFEFLICSPDDHEKLTCEIYYKHEIIAEISQETNEMILEIYEPTKNNWLSIPLVPFQEALELAKNHLKGG